MAITNLRFPQSSLRLLHLQTSPLCLLYRQPPPSRPHLQTVPSRLHLQTAPSRRYVTGRTPAALPIDASYFAKLNAEQLEESLRRLKLDKWGWVIFRTSYKNEAAWDRFRDDIIRRSDEELEQSAASPFVRGAADWTFISDPALEGASHDELRTRFRTWRAKAYYAETQREVPQTGADITSRYLCFFEVDEVALDSISRASEPGGGPAVVNFIECDRDTAFAFKTVPELDKREGGKDYWEWRILADRITCLGFWLTISNTVEGALQYCNTILQFMWLEERDVKELEEKMRAKVAEGGD